MEKSLPQPDVSEEDVSVPVSYPLLQSPYIWWIVSVVIAVFIGFLLFIFFMMDGSEPDASVAIPEVAEQSFSKPIPSTDSVFKQSVPDTGFTWTDPFVAFEQSISNPPQLCALRQQYCNRVGYGYADFGCNCFVYQYYDDFQTFTHDVDRFSVYYPTVWHEVDGVVYDDTLMGKPEFQIIRDNAACRISYGELHMDALEQLGSYSTTTMRVNTGELETINLPFEGLVSDEHAALGYTPWRAVAVPYFGGPPEDRGFIVESGTEEPLLDACVSELRSMVLSRRNWYENVALDESFEGMLWLDEQTLWYIDDKNDSRIVTSLLFEPAGAGRVVQTASATFAAHPYPRDPTIVGSRMYFLDDGQLFALDLFEGESHVIPLVSASGAPVHSFFPDEHFIYYLQGKACNEYMTRCSLDVRRFNVRNGVDELLAQQVHSREILGFDTSGDFLYMRWAEGDAGCTWGAFEYLDIAKGEVGNEGEYAYCYEHEGVVDDPAAAAFQEEVMSRVKGVRRVDHVRLDGEGKISFPEAYVWQEGVLSPGELIRVVE